MYNISHKKKHSVTHHHSKTYKKKYKRLNCHPSLHLKQKKILDYSCFTADALETLKNTYNNKNPNSMITTNNPKEIWEQLYHKNQHCDQEHCWVQNIADKHLRDKISNSFSPFQPSNWKKNKNAWLSNFDIDAVLKQYQETYHGEFISLGPTPIDFDTKKTNGQCVWQELCKLSLSVEYNKGVRKIGIIYNLDTHKGSGTHWVSMFIDMAENTPFIFYFNSTSQRMPKQVKDLINRLQTEWNTFRGSSFQVYKNTRTQHQRTNSECGMYSLFFIITCLTRKTDLMPDKTLTTTDLVELFAGKHRIDDKYVWKFRDVYFNA